LCPHRRRASGWGLPSSAEKKSLGAGSAEARTHDTERTTGPDWIQPGTCQHAFGLWQLYDISLSGLLSSPKDLQARTHTAWRPRHAGHKLHRKDNAPGRIGFPIRGKACAFLRRMHNGAEAGALAPLS